MGPPEKVPHKQDPLGKPSTVSVKTASESPPLPPSTTPTSPSMMRKFSGSPTSNRSTSSVSGKLSPSLIKSGAKGGSSSSSSSSHQSPKHSPAHVPSSPKHSLAGISSPKHHGASPKHPSASGSGKPSMSTLKSAANSPSGKSSGESKSKSGSKEGSSGGSSSSSSGRDKDKKTSSVFGVSNSKNKSASLKVVITPVKPLEGGGSVGGSGGGEAPSGGTPDSLPSPGSGNSADSKSSANQARNRKGSLSAIVDKLKVNAQHCDMATDLSSKSSSGSGGGGSSSGGGGNSANRGRSEQAGEEAGPPRLAAEAETRKGAVRRAT
nr:unnamed protein product [Callosobruchus chinensis]